MTKKVIDPQSYYSTEKIKFQKRQKTLKRLSNNLSWLRLLSFAGSFITLFYAYDNSIIVALISFAALFAAFIILVRYQIKIQYKMSLAKTGELLMEKELMALQGDWTGFDKGNAYYDPEHDFAGDLDIIGKGSLFQYMNRTFSSEGEKKLFNYLLDLSVDKEVINMRQEAINELSEKPQWITGFYCEGKQSNLNDEKYRKLIFWANKAKEKFWTKPRFLLLAILIPLIQALMIVLLVMDKISEPQYIIALIGGLAINGFFIKKVNKVHLQLGKSFDMLKSMSVILNQAQTTEFSSKMLNNLKEQLKKDGISSGIQLKRLSKIVSSLDNRLNLLVGFVLNALVLWDLQQMIRLEKWQLKFGNKIIDWIDTIAEFETLNSLATFAFNHPGFSWPILTDVPDSMECTQAGHPLIQKQKRVCNNFSMKQKEQFVVITGANMAGKSTFLRIIGINMVLASAGTKVCAEKWKYCPVKLLTGIRSDDNLLKNESYFFAELKRLQMIVNKLEHGYDSLILLDEILRGTNSRDKHRGTVLLLKKLLRLKGAGIIATHDLSVGALEEEYPDEIVNKCFEVENNDDELFFDYKLKDGISSKLNASFLLEKMGIVDKEEQI